MSESQVEGKKEHTQGAEQDSISTHACSVQSAGHPAPTLSSTISGQGEPKTAPITTLQTVTTQASSASNSPDLSSLPKTQAPPVEALARSSLPIFAPAPSRSHVPPWVDEQSEPRPWDRVNRNSCSKDTTQ
ncbi:hypothetical protein M231_05769 [Tremella mesenterica]|uniref:Uncharacterized protein n=1 Tax=Tremella mesenterica TaxID=5217 RepID=A0A4Q1BH69_TREME|nr:hypothetical protein M231_05769 [Tremella mesenterica]